MRLKWIITGVTIIAGMGNGKTMAQFGGMRGFNARSTASMVQGYNKGREDGKKMRGYLSYDVGAAVTLGTLNFTHFYQNQDQYGNFIGESTITREFKSKGVLLNAGTYFPVTKLNDKGAIAISAGILASYSNYDIGEVALNPDKRYNYSMMLLQMGVPIGLDVKYGGEAIFDKSEAFSFTAGLGIAPFLYFSAFGSLGTPLKTAARPYLHADIGFFAGIQWKIKTTYFMNTVTTMGVESGHAGMEVMPQGSDIRMTNKPMVSIGLAIMPFSMGWDKNGW